MTQNTSKLKLARYLSWMMAAILVLLPFHALITTWLGSNFEHLYGWKLWKEYAIVASLPAVLWLVINNKGVRRWILSSWFVRLYCIYAMIHFGLGAWAYQQELVSSDALINGLITNLRFGGFFIVVAVAAGSSNFLRRYWVRLTLWPAAAVVIFGVLQKFVLPLNFLNHFGYGPKTIPAYQTVDAANGPPRLQSTLRGANPLGAYLTLGLSSWLAIFWRRKLWLIGGIILGTGVLVYTYSRSAIVATAISGAALAWWLSSRIQRRWFIIALFAGLVAIGGMLYSQRNNILVQQNLYHTSDKSTSPKTSNTVRRSALRHGWSDVVHQPFGRGPGTAGPASQHNSHPARIAENYYIQIAQEVGVIGLAIFVAMNLAVMLKLWSQRSGNLERILLVSLLGISLINLVSHAWADDTISYLWWGLAGIACAPVILKSKKLDR